MSEAEENKKSPLTADSSLEREDKGDMDIPVLQPEQGVGARLRVAREARQMSQADVAQMLKLGMRQIQALEDDRWSELPGKVFIRGFVRNYARLVHVDATPLVAELDANISDGVRLEIPQGTPCDVPSFASAARQKNDAPKGERHVFWVACGLLLLAVLAYFFFADQFSRWREDVENVIDQVQMNGDAAEDAASDEALDRSMAEDLSQPLSDTAVAPLTAGAAVTPPAPAAAGVEAAVVSPASAAGSAPATETTVKPMAKATATPPAATPADSAAAAKSASRNAANTANAANVPGSAAPVATATVMSTTAGAAATAIPVPSLEAAPLAFRLSLDTWMEVRDGSNKPVLMGNFKAGTERTISAKPPLTVIVGYAPGAQLSWRGKNLDLSTYTSGKVAKLRLE